MYIFNHLTGYQDSRCYIGKDLLNFACLQNEYKQSTCKIKFECYSELHSRF